MKKAGVEILDKPEDENVWGRKRRWLSGLISTLKSAIASSTR